jgi:hypothetical protein
VITEVENAGGGVAGSMAISAILTQLAKTDSMTMSAPRTRVDLVVPKPTKEAREKGAEQ